MSKKEAIRNAQYQITKQHLNGLAETVINIAKESCLTDEHLAENMDGLIVAALAQEKKSLENIANDFGKNRELYTKHFYNKLI